MKKSLAFITLFLGCLLFSLAYFSGTPLQAYESGGAPVVTPATGPIDANGQDILNVGNISGVNFTDLDDVPTSYTGQAGLCTKVNPGETALIFGTCGGGGGGDNLGNHTATTDLLMSGFKIDMGDGGNGGTEPVLLSVDDTYGSGFFGNRNQLNVSGGFFTRMSSDIGFEFAPEGSDSDKYFNVFYSAGSPAGNNVDFAIGGLSLLGIGTGANSTLSVVDSTNTNAVQLFAYPSGTLASSSPAIRKYIDITPTVAGAGAGMEFTNGTWVGAQNDGNLYFRDATVTTPVSLNSLAQGVSTFLALTDTPSSFSGQGSKVVRVNSGATALEFQTAVANTACTPHLETTGGGYYTATAGYCVATRNDLGTVKTINVAGEFTWNNNCTGTCSGSFLDLSFELTGYDSDGTTGYTPACAFSIQGVPFTGPQVAASIAAGTDQMFMGEIATTGALNLLTHDADGTIDFSCNFHQ